MVLFSFSLVLEKAAEMKELGPCGGMADAGDLNSSSLNESVGSTPTEGTELIAPDEILSPIEGERRRKGRFSYKDPSEQHIPAPEFIKSYVEYDMEMTTMIYDRLHFGRHMK